MHTLIVLFSALVQAAEPAVDPAAVLQDVMALGGLAGLIALGVNVLKYFGVLKDGQSGPAVAVLNLLLAAGLLSVKQFMPDANVAGWDATLASLASVGTTLFGLFVQFGGSTLVHSIARKMKLPIVGASHADGTVKASAPSKG